MRQFAGKCSPKLALILALSASLALLFPSVSAAKEKKDHERYTAVAVGTRGAVGAGSTHMNFRIDEYTTDEEIMELAEILKEGGPDALRRTLEKIKKGSVSPQARTGVLVAVARARKTEKGLRIILVTARDIRFLEAYQGGRTRAGRASGGRSLDYPFGWFELYVDEEGKGQGRVIVATKIKFNKEGVLEIESYGLEPVSLLNVRRYD